MSDAQNKIVLEVATNGFAISGSHGTAVFVSKREALDFLSDMMPDIEAESVSETLRLRRVALDGVSLFDQYLTEVLRLQGPIQDVLRCFDNIMAMSACTGISERAIRNWLHYGQKTPSRKTLARAKQWLRSPIFIAEVQDDE